MGVADRALGRPSPLAFRAFRADPSCGRRMGGILGNLEPFHGAAEDGPRTRFDPLLIRA